MRWIGLFAFVLACGRGGKEEAVTSPETATGPGAAGLLACQAAVRAMDAFVACAPSADDKLIAEHFQAKTREVFSSTKPLKSELETRATARMCLADLDGMARDMAKKKCGFALTTQERAWLEAERRRRTPVPAEAKGADRDMLAKLAATRDRACACKDIACVDAIEAELDKDTTRLSKDASIVLRDAGGEMIDELFGCARRLRTDVALAEPGGPGDPTAVRAFANQIRAERAAAAAAANRPPPPPVTLPDGKTLSLAGCKALAKETDREACEVLFDEVAECQGRGADTQTCVDDAVKEYLEWIAEDDGGGGFEDDEDIP